MWLRSLVFSLVAWVIADPFDNLTTESTPNLYPTASECLEEGECYFYSSSTLPCCTGKCYYSGYCGLDGFRCMTETDDEYDDTLVIADCSVVHVPTHKPTMKPTISQKPSLSFKPTPEPTPTPTLNPTGQCVRSGDCLTPGDTCCGMNCHYTLACDYNYRCDKQGEGDDSEDSCENGVDDVAKKQKKTDADVDVVLGVFVGVVLVIILCICWCCSCCSNMSAGCNCCETHDESPTGGWNQVEPVPYVSLAKDEAEAVLAPDPEEPLHRQYPQNTAMSAPVLSEPQNRGELPKAKLPRAEKI